MSCSKCGTKACCCKETVITERGKAGKRGHNAKNLLKVVDARNPQGVVLNVREIRFTDLLAQVTQVSPGVAEVNLVPPATVWNDIQNLPWYVTGSESIKPQYTIEGNRIAFRGLLYLPLDNTGLVNISGANSYLGIASCAMHSGSVSVITNANSNNGTPQGRFLTSDIVNLKNLPTDAIPISRDIEFSEVPCYRRYSSGGRVTVYRSVVDLRIGSLATVFKNGVTNIGSGCFMVFSPFNKEYDGSGNPPLGNDPLALQISRVTNATDRKSVV